MNAAQNLMWELNSNLKVIFENMLKMHIKIFCIFEKIKRRHRNTAQTTITGTNAIINDYPQESHPN